MRPELAAQQFTYILISQNSKILLKSPLTLSSPMNNLSVIVPPTT